MGLLNHVLDNVDKERVELQRRLALAEERNDILTRALVVAHHENRALGLTVRGLCCQLRSQETQEENRKSFDIWGAWANTGMGGAIAAGIFIAVVALTSLAFFAQTA